MAAATPCMYIAESFGASAGPYTIENVTGIYGWSIPSPFITIIYAKKESYCYYAVKIDGSVAESVYQSGICGGNMHNQQIKLLGIITHTGEITELPGDFDVRVTPPHLAEKPDEEEQL